VSGWYRVEWLVDTVTGRRRTRVYVAADRAWREVSELRPLLDELTATAIDETQRRPR
jgi:hypothetical protein